VSTNTRNWERIVDNNFNPKRNIQISDNLVSDEWHTYILSNYKKKFSTLACSEFHYRVHKSLPVGNNQSLTLQVQAKAQYSLISILDSITGRPITQAVSLLRPSLSHGFDPRSGNVGFVVDKEALGQVFFEYFGFPCQLLLHQMLHT
jgi:hypothetical protein